MSGAGAPASAALSGSRIDAACPALSFPSGPEGLPIASA